MSRRVSGSLCWLLAGCLLAAQLPAAAAAAGRQSPPPAAMLLQLPGSDADAGAAPLAEDEALNRIIEAVQRRYNARVVRVTEITVDGKRCYDLRLLSDERVWMIRVDAETGQEMPRND